MLKFFLDVVVLAFLLYIVLRQHTPDLSHIGLVSFGLAVAHFLLLLVLGELLGIFSIIPWLALDLLAFMVFFHLTLKQSLITVAVLIVYNLAFYYLWM